ncbi:MAG: hypothetical protein IJA01_02575 [Firmicutes bacterium]|nr:hypothetical protein [Bacillota bacterium]
MTMKKKLLTTLSVVLILGLAALGILAYLTDTDSDVNVMTLGNVSIEQTEYQRVVENGEYKTATIDGQNSYVLEKFDQDKALLPSAINTTTWEGWDWDTTTTVRMTQVGSYGGMQVFKEASNAQDKFVVVKNTGKTDAYVRTLVAIEVGSTDGSLIGTSYHQTWTKTVPAVGTVAIDGNNYYVFEYVYNGADGVRHEGGILPAGDTAYPNLSQVYIKSAATNEDMVKLDGNGNGKLDILVLSQAGQVEGFETVGAASALDTMFGETTVDNAKKWFNSLFVDEWDGTVDKAWFDADVAAAATPENPVVFEVDTAEEFTGFVNLANTNSFKNVTVKLTKDIDLGGSNWNEGGTIAAYGPAFSGTLDGNGHTIYNLGAANNWTYANALFRTIGNDVTIKNLNIEDANINNAAASGNNKEYAILVGIVGSGTLTIENVTIADSSVSCKNSAGILVGGMTEGAIRCKDVTIENCAVNVSSASGKGGAVLGDGWSAHDYDYAGVYTDNVKLVNCTYTVAGVLQAELPLYNYVK